MGFILKDAPNSVWNLREWALKYVAKPPSVGLPLQKSDSRLQNGRHWVSISFQPLIEWWACLDTPSWMLNNFASSPHKKSKLFFQWLALIYVCYVMFWTARCCKYFCAQCSGLFMSWVVTFLTQMWYWLFCLYFSILYFIAHQPTLPSVTYVFIMPRFIHFFKISATLYKNWLY